MVQDKTVTIGKHTYKLRQLGARDGRKLYLRIGKVIAAGIRAATLIDSEGANDRIMVAGIAGVVESLDEATLDALCDQFGAVSSVRIADDKGERWPELTGIVFDQHFAANYTEMMIWLGENIAYNFASFLGDGGIGKLIDRAQAAASKFQSPKTTTGSSSGS